MKRNLIVTLKAVDNVASKYLYTKNCIEDNLKEKA